VTLRHSAQEIAAKLSLASELLEGAQSKAAICKKLGISVMTLHRWQKHANSSRTAAVDELLVAELKLENDRLRQIASGLALEIAEVYKHLSFAIGAPGSQNVRKSPGRKAA
jgi:transposase-like protein